MIIHPLYGRVPKPDLLWPVRTGGSTGRVGSFGMTRTDQYGKPKMHRGVDWLAAQDTAIYASHDGRIIRAGEQAGGGGFGLRLYLLSGEGQGQMLTIYAHMSVQYVKIKDEVRAGHCIGRIGRTGNVPESAEDHLHHEVRLGGQGAPNAVDPVWWYHEQNIVT
jgi:murein DD-endopeptidase MepM/ murein hydrolase activator NlpD